MADNNDSIGSIKLSENDELMNLWNSLNREDRLQTRNNHTIDTSTGHVKADDIQRDVKINKVHVEAEKDGNNNIEPIETKKSTDKNADKKRARKQNVALGTGSFDMKKAKDLRKDVEDMRLKFAQAKSRSLAYGIDDKAVAQLAKKQGKKEIRKIKSKSKGSLKKYRIRSSSNDKSMKRSDGRRGSSSGGIINRLSYLMPTKRVSRRDQKVKHRINLQRTQSDMHQFGSKGRAPSRTNSTRIFQGIQAETMRSLNECDSTLLSYLWQLHDKFDGKYSIDELYALYRRFQKMDKNGNGNLEFVEVLEVIREAIKGIPGMEKEIKEKVITFYEKLDRDGNGDINFDEFLQFLEAFDGCEYPEDYRDLAEIFVRKAHGIEVELDPEMEHRLKLVLETAQQKYAQQLTVGLDTYLFLPTSAFSIAWSLFISTLLILTVLSTPLVLAFETVEQQMYSFNVLIDFLFILDIIKVFTTGIVDDGKAQVIVLDARIVAKTYLKSWFLIDLVSSIPLDLFSSSDELSDCSSAFDNSAVVNSSTKSLKVVRLLKLTRLLRVIRMSRLTGRFRETASRWGKRFGIYFPGWVFSLVLVALYLFVAAHWMGMISFMFVRMNNYPLESWPVSTGLISKLPFNNDTFINDPSRFKCISEEVSPANFSKFMVEFHQDGFSEYQFAFIRALTHFTGDRYMDVTCTMSSSSWCKIESTLTAIDFYIGNIFLAFVIATIANIIGSLDLAGSEFRKRKKHIEQYVKNKGLPPHLKQHAIQQFRVRHSDEKVFNEDEILSNFCSPLQEKIRMFNVKPLVQSVPLLYNSHMRFVQMLSVKLKLEVYTPNDLIFREGAIGDEMFFINSGLVEIVSKFQPACAAAAIGDGCYFGDVATLLRDKPNRLASSTGAISTMDDSLRFKRRSASAISKTVCQLYRINREDLMECLVDFKGVMEYMMRIAEQRFLRVKKLQPMYKSLDVAKVDEEDAKTKLFMSTALVIDPRMANYHREQMDSDRRKSSAEMLSETRGKRRSLIMANPHKIHVLPEENIQVETVKE